MSHFYGMRFSVKTMLEYKDKGWAIEATKGGLVIGRSHDEGGIYIWVLRDTHYVLEAEVEGYEYILNLGATHYFKDMSHTFHRYYEHKKMGFVPYDPSLNIMTLDTRNSMEPKYLLFDTGGFSVVNKYSTRGYLQTLDIMNRSVSFESIGNNQARLVHNSTEPIEVRFFNESQGYIRRKED